MSLVTSPDNAVSPPVDLGREESVLFDVPDSKFSAFAAELRRLSQKPFRFRWLPTPDEAIGRVLVLANSPPSLIVSRVIEEKIIQAYREQAPGVWVRLTQRISEIPAVPTNHLLLVRDIVEAIPLGELCGEIEPLQLALSSAALAAGSSGLSIPTRLRLIPAVENQQARLWVLREDALAQLAEYCRTTHQQLLSRFSVAVSATAGVPCVVLRAITTKGPPPVFVGSAVAYHPVLKLANLFVPSGTRLAPSLRRDAIRKALVFSDDRIVWLHPLAGKEFQVESLPEKSFRPLADWVDYRVTEPGHACVAWSPGHSWAMNSFVERSEVKQPSVDTSSDESKLPVPRRTPGFLARMIARLKRLRLKRRLSIPELELQTMPVDEAVRTALNQGHRLNLARPETATRAAEHCQVLEARLLRDLSASMNAEGRTEQWAELAAAYDAAGNHKDAALCWLNGVWGQEKLSPLWAWGWLRAEAKAARPEVKSIDPIPWLSSTPGPGTTRALAAWVVWASQQHPLPDVFQERMVAIQACLEANEHFLPVRAAWLTRVSLSRHGQGDVLGLARTRDRLSERLVFTGLSLELDTPSFLRFAGDGVRERFLEARRWLVDKRDLIHQWIGQMPEEAKFHAPPGPASDILRSVGLVPEVKNTRGYVDLILAWGLMRFAEHSAADTIRKQAFGTPNTDEPVHAVLRAAFEYRIHEVREGKPPRGPLPAVVQSRIDQLDPDARYFVDKLCEHSRILVPAVRVETYRRMLQPKSVGDSSRVENLPADRLNEGLAAILQAELDRPGQPHLEWTMSVLLDRVSDLTEERATLVFNALPQTLDRLRDSPRPQARLLEKGLAAAAIRDRVDVARDLAGRFMVLADGRAGRDMAEMLTGHLFRCLRRLGLKNDADHVLNQVAERVTQGQPLGRLRSTRPEEWPLALRCLLHVAAGWYYAGKDEQAHAILDEARSDLFSAEMTTANRTALALTYASTLAQAPARVALGRLEEIFQRLKGLHVEGYTNAYFALNPLLLVERAVLAVVSDDFAVGPQVRAWLDADELAVRRRIREELKVMLGQQGL